MLRLPRKRALSRYPTRARQSARCHHSTQPCKCDSHKTRNNTRLERCTCHAASRWTSPKYRACHTKHHKTKKLSPRSETYRLVTKCHGHSKTTSTTSFETFKNEEFGRFSRRLGDATKNNGIKTGHVGNPKRTFHAKLSQGFTFYNALYSYKIIEDGIPTAKLFGFGLL